MEMEDVPIEFIDAMIIKLVKFHFSSYKLQQLAINKILSIIIHDRISKVEPILRKKQAGFRPHRSCVDHTDHISTLRIIMEQSVDFNTALYMLFIDFEQTFDSLDRGRFW